MSEHARQVSSACKSIPVVSNQEITRESTSSIVTGAETLTRMQEDAASKTTRRSGPKSSSSNYIGVSAVKSSKYKKPGRWEAHIWDRGVTEGSKGRQLHLGSFPSAIQAARAYDRAAYIMRGPDSELNFPADNYKDDTVIPQLIGLSKQEVVMAIRCMQKEEEEAQERGQQSPANQEEAAAACLSELLTRKKQQATHKQLPPKPSVGDRKIKEELVPVPTGANTQAATRPHFKKQLFKPAPVKAQPMSNDGGLHIRTLGQTEIIARRAVKRKAPDTNETSEICLPQSRRSVPTSTGQPKPRSGSVKPVRPGVMPAIGVSTTAIPHDVLCLKTNLPKAQPCKIVIKGTGPTSTTSKPAAPLSVHDTAVPARVTYNRVQDARARLEAQILAAGNISTEEVTFNTSAAIPMCVPAIKTVSCFLQSVDAQTSRLPHNKPQPVSGDAITASTPPVIATPLPATGQPVAVTCTQDELSQELQGPLLHSPVKYSAHQCIQPLSPVQSADSPKDESSSGAADLLAFKHGIQDLAHPSSSTPHSRNGNLTPTSPKPYRRGPQSGSSQFDCSPNIGLQMPSPALLLSPVSWSKAFKSASSPPADPAGILPLNLVQPSRPVLRKLDTQRTTPLPASSAIPDEGVPLVLSHRQQSGILPYWHAVVYAAPSASSH